MGERWYLRTMSDLGPMYLDGRGSLGAAGTVGAEGPEFCLRWVNARSVAWRFDSRESAHQIREAFGLSSAWCHIVRVGPPRRYTLTEKGRAATEPARQGVDGTPDVVAGVPSPAARPEAVCGPAGPERVPVTGTWCADSPVHEHAWQWRDGGLVCAHCGGRRVGP